MTIISREQVKTESTELVRKDSLQQPVWHVVVLFSLTATSIYLLFWAYKTWSILKQLASDEKLVAAQPALALFKNINPALRTAALLAPILVGFLPFVHFTIKLVIGSGLFIYTLSSLFIGITSLYPKEDSLPRKHPLILCGVLIAVGIVISNLAWLGGPWLIVSWTAGAVPAAFLQHWLNSYLRTIEPEALFVRHGFNGFEMVAIILGAGLLGLIAAGMMINVPTR